VSAGTDERPDWEDDAVVVLSTAGPAPHAIPVSTAVRLGPLLLVFGLARRRSSLERLRNDPAVALTFLGRDVACTALGRADVISESLEGVEGVAGVRVRVDEVRDHRQPRFAMDAGVRWHWVQSDAAAADATVRRALRRLRSLAEGSA
jgi:hypothetical protein